MEGSPFWDETFVIVESPYSTTWVLGSLELPVSLESDQCERHTTNRKGLGGVLGDERRHPSSKDRQLSQRSNNTAALS